MTWYVSTVLITNNFETDTKRNTRTLISFFLITFVTNKAKLSTVGSPFTKGLRSRISGCKLNRCKISKDYLNGLNWDSFMGQTN